MSKVKIGLDLRGCEPGYKQHFGRGTWRYITQLLKHIELQEQSNFEFVKLSQKDLSATKLQQNFISMMPFGKQTLENQLFLSSRIKKQNMDLVHFFAHGDAPTWGSTPQIISVLDLIPLKFAHLYSPDKGGFRFWLARTLENKAIQNAKGIIAISESTKKDLIEILDVSPDQVFVTPLAVSNVFSPATADFSRSEVLEHFGLSEKRPILLYVGGIDARKNIFFMLEMFRELLGQLERENRPQLVFSGAHQKDDKYPKFKAKIAELNLESDVVELGFVADEMLPDLYRASDFTLFPSLYEGFGFPVLESMACGVPVLAGDNSSVTEIMGDRSKLLPDNQLDSWVKACLELLSSEQSRIAYKEHGLERAKLFTWDKTAKLTLEAYQSFDGSVAN